MCVWGGGEGAWSFRGQEGWRRDELRAEQMVELAVQVGPPALTPALARKEEQKLGKISPASPTPHPRRPTFCVSVFNQQSYDYKGLKQEGLVTKPGGTQELRVGGAAPAAGRSVVGTRLGSVVLLRARGLIPFHSVLS